MARPLRIEFEGALYHVTARGIEKRDIFQSESDRKMFIKHLQEGLLRNSALLYCYVLMNNHYHLLLETLKANLSEVMHDINTRYTINFNLKHHRVGHLFQGRYKGILVERESYLLALSRYIHLNPVRAGFVKRPEDYKWSSYREYIGLKNKEKWINYDWIQDYFGRENEKVESAYQKFVEEGIEELESPLKKTYAQIVLGSEKFIKGLRERTQDFSHNTEIPSIKILTEKPIMKNMNIDEIVRQVTLYYGVEKEVVKIQGQKNNRARQISVYLVRKYTGAKTKEIGTYFGGTGYTGVCNIVSRVEKRKKQDRDYDRELGQLERRICVTVKT